MGALVTLHDRQTSGEILVSPRHVCALIPQADGCEVVTNGGRWLVTESAESLAEVLAMHAPWVA